MRRVALTALAVAAVVIPSSARSGERVVLVPFENAARVPSAREVVMSAAETALAAKGYEVVTGSVVRQFLRARRIRFLDSMTERHLRELTAALQADTVVLGTVLAFGGMETTPEVAIAASAFGRDGSRLWHDLVTMSAAETEGAFGLGRVSTREALAQRAVAKLFTTAPLGQSGGGEWRLERGPRVYRSRYHIGAKATIAVLPVQNLTESRLAPRTVDALVHHHLSAQPDVTVVSPAELRAGLVARALRSPAQLPPEGLRALGEAVGARLFLRGTILAYGPSSELGAGAEIELHLLLLDVESGQIVWSGLHRRTARDYERLLKIGLVSDTAAVADRAVSELVYAFLRPCVTLEEGCGSYPFQCCSW